MVAIDARPGPAEPAPGGPSRSSRIVSRAVTLLVVVGPVAAIAVAVPLLWGHAVSLRDLLLAAGFYLVTCLGVTVGYHRLFTHRSFRPARWLKITLASAGSMAVQGSLVSWVANHRVHHVFSDQPGDPHSPHLHGTGLRAQMRGLLHAHVGWLFRTNAISAERYAADVLRDPDTRTISRLFPVFALASLAIPFFIGWTLSGAISGALTALLWAGLARMMILHHVTWSVNSICHMFGRQPAAQDDHSRDFAPLAIVSLGESWHNFHHAHPSSARHGAQRGQVDISAAFIRLCELTGCATNVRWPTEAQLAACTTR